MLLAESEGTGIQADLRLCSDEDEIEDNIRDEIWYDIRYRCEGALKSLLTGMLQRKAPSAHHESQGAAPLNHKSTQL